jgi:hypothetical protein
MTGDGEYSLTDLMRSIELLMSTSFAVVLGSRTQSRRQFLKSIRSAYGEGSVLYHISWLGTLVLSALFGVRFRIVLSDPLTGFLVFRRDRLPSLKNIILNGRPNQPSVVILRRLLESNTEIAEIPVSYKTFSGFTVPSLR